MTLKRWITERLEKAEKRTKRLAKWVDTGVKPRQGRKPFDKEN